MAKRTERIFVRLSERDVSSLQKIQKNGEFDDTSSAVRWCIKFTTTMLSVIPAALAESFIRDAEEDALSPGEISLVPGASTDPLQVKDI